MSINILLDDLPEYVEIDGKRFFVDTDFRTFIILERVILDADMEDREKVLSIVDLVYTDERPEDTVTAFTEALELYRCGEQPQTAQKPQKNGQVELKPKMIYSYEHDAPYIYGAFMSQYGIDLNAVEYLHWWKFQALFRSLSSDNKIVEIMGYRATDISKIKSKSEKERIAKMQRVYALPVSMTFEEKVARAGAAFGGVSF